MTDKRFETVTRLWEEHLQALFPARWRGLGFADVDMVLLDSYTAGCVSFWLGNHGQLDPWRCQVIASCLDDLNQVQPLLTDPHETSYCNRLRELASLIAQAPGSAAHDQECEAPPAPSG